MYFRIIFWWLLLALEPLIQESGDPPDTRSPTQPPPKSRLSEIKLNFHKTRLPCLSSWLLQASAKIGLITLPRTPKDILGTLHIFMTWLLKGECPTSNNISKRGAEVVWVPWGAISPASRQFKGTTSCTQELKFDEIFTRLELFVSNILSWSAISSSPFRYCFGLGVTIFCLGEQ